jgi:hypothetical protein
MHESYPGNATRPAAERFAPNYYRRISRHRRADL